MDNRNQIKNRFNNLLNKYRSDDLSKSEYQEFLKSLQENEVESQIEHLTLEDWQPSNQILSKIMDEKRAKKKRRSLYKIVSAAAAIAIMLVMFNIFQSNLKYQNPKYIEYQTAFGETKSIGLPDGSEVLLNANSRLLWDENWKYNKVREVKISGEAFFDVKHFQDNMKFVVDANQVKVNVTGTTFNVRDRGGEVDVFLNSGKVDLEISDQEGMNVTMEPGNHIVYKTDTRKIHKEESKSLSNTASWVEGMLEFENKYVPQILDRFEELYGVDFSIENSELLEKRMDLSLPYSNWDLIKKALEISLNAEFTEVENTIVVK
ncbi:FecR family protein [Membranihabitans maritimus]|uniref:FecR family protein n=1 Tax=Membranihabitans maritimus TaxID=2904244 RepID=UPI001F18DE67